MSKGAGFGLRACILAVPLLISAAAGAEPFRWQLVGALHNSERSNDAEVETGSFGATYYFSPVDDSRGPLAVAPFLSRSSHVSGSAQRIDQSQTLTVRLPSYLGGGTIVSTSSSESETYSVDGRRVWRESGWFIGGGLQYFDPYERGSDRLDVDIDAYAFSIGGGKYLGASTSIELGLGSSRSTTKSLRRYCQFPIVCIPGEQTIQTLTRATNDMDAATLSIVHVGGLDGLAYMVSGHAVSQRATTGVSITTLGPENQEPPLLFGPFPGGVVSPYPLPASTYTQTYEVTGTIFPTRRIGVRLGLTSFDDVPADFGYEVGASWYFRPRTAVEFGYARTDYDSGYVSFSRDAALIRFSGRF